MNTSLAHLTVNQHKMLGKAVDIIVRAIRPEKIILFGMYSRLADPGFLKLLPPALTAFDLLVITREKETRSDYEIQDIIESRCREEAAVTALVHDITYVNKRVRERQYFFSTVLREGTLVYDARLTNLA